MVLYHWTIVDVLDRKGGYISLDAHPMTMELGFFLIFETHLLVFLHDMVLVAVININILHSVNISFEILWIFTAVFIFFLFQTCLLNFHVNGQPRMKA